MTGPRARVGRLLLAAILVAGALLAACETQGGPRAAPSAPTVPPNFPFPSGGVVPIPTALSGLNSGGAHIELTGAVEKTLDLPLGSPTFFQGGIMALLWQGPSGDLLTLAGIASGNQASTSSTLLLTISVVELGETFVSTGSECTIMFDSLESTAVLGTFRCRGFKHEGKSVAADGSFTANA